MGAGQGVMGPGYGAARPEYGAAGGGQYPPRYAGRGLRLVWIYPDLLSTYGDRGNLLVLERRARLRGMPVEVLLVDSGQPVPPDGDIYLMGGGEDLPQVLAARRLRADGGLAAAVRRGAVLFAVCAGYQVIGRLFPDTDGRPRPGVGLLDVTTEKGTTRRAVGEILTDASGSLNLLGTPLRPPTSAPTGKSRTRRVGRTSPELLTGFENHSGVSRVGEGAIPLGRVLAGVGNGGGSDSDGAICGRVIGTYMHGPVLARNPALADAILSMVSGESLEPLDDEEEDALRADRLAALRPTRRLNLGRAPRRA